MKNKLFTTKNIAGMAVFTALSFVLSLPAFEIPLFPGTPYKLDFSSVFILLGGFMYGPYGGLIILAITQILHIPVGSSAGVGELANFLIGISFIAVPAFVYRVKKGFKTVVITLIIGCMLSVGVGILANKFILLPFFGCAEMFSDWFWFIVLLNLIKSLSCSVFSVILYKKLFRLFKRIYLLEQADCVDGIITKSEAETRKVAFEYAKTLSRGDVVLMYGDLGAGKTAFIKGVCEYLGLEGVKSPTYAYLNVYGDTVYHYDCYRLSSGEDAEALGLTDYFNGDNYCFIEWPDNIKSALPKEYKTVKIEKLSGKKRKIIL